MRVCKICKVEKPLTEMTISQTNPVKIHYKHVCNECTRKNNKIVYHLRKANPLPPLGTACPICLRDNVKLYLDHNWVDNSFRGYICNTCNTALGKLFDDVDVLNRAIAYLEG